jgi:hypothetical protein
VAPDMTASNIACRWGEVVWWMTSSLAIIVQGGVPAEADAKDGVTLPATRAAVH